MTTEHLQALVIDDHLGELSPEVSALLAAYLQSHASAQVEAERIRESMRVMAVTVQTYPSTTMVSPQAPELIPIKRRSLHKWAAVAAALMLAGVTGWWIGQEGSSSTKPIIAQAQPVKSPWTRYRIQADPKGNGLQVIPVNP
jgi:hypothetical protein